MNSSRQQSPLEKLVSRLQARLSLAALMASFYDQTGRYAVQHDRPKLNSLNELLALCDRTIMILSIIEQAAQLIEGDRDFTLNTPIIYNTTTFDASDPWSATAEKNTLSSPTKVLTGHRSLWDLQQSSPATAINRLLKATVWLIEKQKSITEGLNYLFSLVRAGLISHSFVLFHVIERLAGLYCRAEGLPQIANLSFSEVDQQKADYLVMGIDRDMLLDLGKILLQETILSIQRAKKATNPTEWARGIAITSILLEATHRFIKSFELIDALTLNDRIQYLSLEEIYCDLGAMRFCDLDGFNISFSLEASWSMASAILIMQATDGIEAIKRTLGARMLLPDLLWADVEHYLENLEEGQFANPIAGLPLEWQEYSHDVAHVLAHLRSINFRILRRGLNEEASAAIKLIDAKEDPSLSKLGGSGLSENGGQETAGSFAEIQKEEKKSAVMDANFNELRSLTDTFIQDLESNRPQRSESLKNVLDTFPLYEPLLQERAILRDESGDTNAALDDIMEAICLNPISWLHWQSLSVISRKLGWASDGVIAKMVASYLEEQ